MLYDDALRAVGDFGRYQYFILVYCGISSASVAMSVYAFVFIISTGNYWCKSPNTNDFNVTFNYGQNSSSQTKYSDSSSQHSQCAIYRDLHNSSYSQDTFDSLGNNNSEMEIGCPYGWVYEDADTETTITMEWDLVCHREHLVGITQTLYMAGNLFGIILSGLFADRFGRFKTLLLFQTIFATSATIAPFSTDVIMFSVLRFFTGISSLPSTSTALILLLEIVTPEKRAYATSLRYLFWMSGMLLAVGAAYLFRNWRTFMLVIATPTMLNAIVLLFIPESPRWLYTKGRYKEGDAVMAKFAKWNGYPKLQDKIETTEKKEDGSREKVGILKLLCKYPRLLGRIAVMAYIWSAVVLAFFGLTFNSISLGNKYLNFAISAAIEMPTYVLIGVALDRLGRRNMTGVPLLVGGSVLLLIMAVPSDPDLAWVLIIMTNIGKFGFSITFGVIYPYTTELFPTVVRNSALGFASTCGRFSSLIAPQLTLLAMRNKYIPLAIFGALTLLAGALTFLLPETTGLTLPETLDDGERLGMKREHKNDMADIKNEENLPALASNTEEC